MKKRTTYIYLAAFLLMAGAAWYFYTHQKSGTIPTILKDFAVQDTANIDKIFLADRGGNQSILERSGPGKWIVNKKYPAYQDRVDLLLETIKLVEVKSPVSLAARDNVIRELGAGAVKVEIYRHGELAKTYYVGGETQDQLGTKMLIEGSNEPFITHIPGFNGYLSPRYFAEEADWRTHTLYDYLPTDISEVSVQYTEEPKNSFILSYDGEHDFSIKQSPEAPAAKPSSIEAKRYLVGFHNPPFEYEGFATYFKPAQADSLRNSRPVAIISVKLRSGSAPGLKVFRKHVSVETKGISPEGWDTDRAYGILSTNEKEILILQTRNLQRYLRAYGEFMK